ncbi:MAG: Rrf2 family transcriptional regulator, partial [Deltaproteobacteria bacterium]|nr:Rrf2 family transcriptional regulator [Deltaproteobacteria bacterium]
AGIAAEEALSPVSTAKLMRQLRLAGLVESRRGAAGGYSLTRPAEEITVWDAIRALDDSYLPGSPCDCTPADRLDCRRTTRCALTSLWRKLGDEIRQTLQAVSLASLCEGSLERPERFELPVVSEGTDPTRAWAGDAPTRTPREARGQAHQGGQAHQERSTRWSA